MIAEGNKLHHARIIQFREAPSRSTPKSGLLWLTKFLSGFSVVVTHCEPCSVSIELSFSYLVGARGDARCTIENLSSCIAFSL